MESNGDWTPETRQPRAQRDNAQNEPTELARAAALGAARQLAGGFRITREAAENCREAAENILREPGVRNALENGDIPAAIREAAALGAAVGWSMRMELEASLEASRDGRLIS